MHCGTKHKDGWLCVLKDGHNGEHLSIDNTQVWEGSPGAPVTWGLTREVTDELAGTAEIETDRINLAVHHPSAPKTVQGAGVCECGGMMVWRGTCQQCTLCGAGGSCG